MLISGGGSACTERYLGEQKTENGEDTKQEPEHEQKEKGRFSDTDAKVKLD